MGLGYTPNASTIAAWSMDDAADSPVIADTLGLSPMLVQNAPARVAGPLGGDNWARSLTSGSGQHMIAAGGDEADAFAAGEWCAGGWIRLNAALSGSTLDSFGIALFGRLQAWWARAWLRGDGAMTVDWDGANFYVNILPPTPGNCVLQPGAWTHLGFKKSLFSTGPDKYAVTIYVNGSPAPMGGSVSAVNPVPSAAMGSYLRLGTLGSIASTGPFDFSDWWIESGATADFAAIYAAGVSSTAYVPLWRPRVDNVSPSAGDNIDRSTPVQFRVSDYGGLSSVLITARFTGSSVVEVVYADGAFTPAYSTSLVAGPSEGPLDFRLLRTGGWLAGTAPKINVYAFDAAGSVSA